MNLSQIKKSKLLSFLLNASQDNIKDDLSEIFKPDSELKSIFNYEFLVKTFDGIGLSKQAAEADRILSQIQNNENNKK